MDSRPKAFVPFIQFVVACMSRARSLDQLRSKWDRPIEWMVQNVYVALEYKDHTQIPVSPMSLSEMDH